MFLQAHNIQRFESVVYEGILGALQGTEMRKLKKDVLKKENRKNRVSDQTW